MNRVRFVMVGGFLGAGKTTTLARLARHYVQSGLRVGLVTNDQAFDLVDTESLRSQGFEVGEVTGACFCCKFNDLVQTVEGLQVNQTPDVILAEPVGSCTDLVATVVEPLKHLYGEQYETAPYAVLLKPEHGRKILAEEGDVGFSPKAAYIFLKQLEEADVIVINKIDKLSAEEQQRLAEQVRERFPRQQVLLASARQGTGFTELLAALSGPRPERLAAMDVDYDVYAEGEAELGWLNCTVHVRRPDGGQLSLDAMATEMVERLRQGLLAAGAEPAHLKVLAAAEGETAIANLVSSTAHAELSLASGAHCDRADLIVNARVAMDPESLSALVEEQAALLAAAHGLEFQVAGLQSFRPGRPVPTHRM